MALQSLIKVLYPPQCVMCEAQTDSDFALCGSCWTQTPFIDGLCCDGCGAPLIGHSDDRQTILCDDCMTIARPWSKGRSALVYKDNARRFVMSLKHGDRTDLARAAGPWMARAGSAILKPDVILVPIPLHPMRLFRRRFNQAALLAQSISRETGLQCIPDALTRPKKTAPLEGHTLDQRFQALEGAITAAPKRKEQLDGRTIALVDDVMTSGATFAAATQACFDAGAGDVFTLALARVVKDA